MTPRVLRQSNLHAVQELREVLAGVWGLGPWNRGEKDIQTGVESESSHHGQEVPEGRAPAPLWMPLGITIVLQVRTLGAWNTIHVHQRMHWGWAGCSAWLLDQYRVLEMESEASHLMGTGSGRPPESKATFLCFCLQPLVSWAVWPLLFASLSASAPFSSLKAGFLCLFMASLLSTPPSSSLFAGLL